MLAGNPPFTQEDILQTCTQVNQSEQDNEFSIYANVLKKKLKFQVGFSTQAKDLILKILKPDPKERLPLDQMLIHPWFKSWKQSIMTSSSNFDLSNISSNPFILDEIPPLQKEKYSILNIKPTEQQPSQKDQQVNQSVFALSEDVDQQSENTESNQKYTRSQQVDQEQKSETENLNLNANVQQQEQIMPNITFQKVQSIKNYQPQEEFEGNRRNSIMRKEIGQNSGRLRDMSDQSIQQKYEFLNVNYNQQIEKFQTLTCQNKEMDQKLENIDQETNQLKEILKYKHIQLQEIEQNETKLTNELRECNMKIEKYRQDQSTKWIEEENQKAQDQYLEMQSQVGVILNEIKVYNRQLNNKKIEVTRLHEEWQSLKKQNEDLRKTMVSKKLEIDKTLEKLNTEKQIKEFLIKQRENFDTQQIQDASKIHEMILQQFKPFLEQNFSEEAKQKCQMMGNQISELEAQIEKQKHQKEVEIANLKEKIKMEIEELKRTLKEEKQKILQGLQYKYDKEKKELQEELRKLRDEDQQLIIDNYKLNNLKLEIQKEQGLIQELRQENQQLTNTVNDQTIRLQEQDQFKKKTTNDPKFKQIKSQK